MDAFVSEWIGKYVKIDTTFGYYYKGTVIGSDKDFILFKDFNGKMTMIRIGIITLIKEVEK